MRATENDEFSRNLRRLCQSADSISAVCRDIGINRQQFNKYLSGQTSPSNRNLRKICRHFGVTSDQLYGRSGAADGTGGSRWCDHLRNELVASREAVGRYHGYYFRYQYSTLKPGWIVKSLMRIYERGGHAVSKSVVRLAPGGEFGSTKAYKYDGAVLFLQERLFILDIERLVRSEWSQTVLCPSYTGVVDRLYGLRLGVSASPAREPFASRLVLEHLGRRPAARALMREVGIFPADHRAIPRWAREALGGSVAPDERIFWGLPMRGAPVV